MWGWELGREAGKGRTGSRWHVHDIDSPVTGGWTRTGTEVVDDRSTRGIENGKGGRESQNLARGRDPWAGVTHGGAV
jgi:hypothetical protein